MDLLDNGDSCPSNVILSPISNSYSSPTTTITNTNTTMIYSQLSEASISPHQAPNIPYYQPSQQQPMYNNYVQSSSNQVAPSYSMPPTSAQQQRMLPVNHQLSSLKKRQPLIHHEQKPSINLNQRQQQLQLHKSTSVTLPQVSMR